MPVMVLAVLRNGNHSQVKKVEIESDITTSTMIYFRPIIGLKNLLTRERLLNLIDENPKITRKELIEKLSILIFDYTISYRKT